MEVSRTYPQGFFSYLKSLFISNVGRQPLYVPDVELRFFEASCDHFKEIDKKRLYPEGINYTTTFPQQTTRCIWCNISGKWVKWQPSRMYTLSYNIYRPNRTLLYHMTEEKLKIPLECCDISFFNWRSFGYGWREPGNWPTGEYQAEVLIDGTSVATSHFTIAPPPPPKPPEEVLQHPRVQFYASGRKTIRFSQQTTREVICELTVRNLLYGQQGRTYPLTAQCFTVEGRLLWESKPSWWISSQEQEPSISLNIQMAGWSLGIYRVEILIDGKEFAWGAFAVE